MTRGRQGRREDRRASERADQRTPFARDRDRILYSSALRRLAGVTQVVHAAEGHVFHNRLTHAIKVAQVARRLAERLRDDFSTMPAARELEPEVAEAAALAHDLGHPPFGHIAEEELDSEVRRAGLADGFEGNAQSFRIVTKLAYRSAAEDGLNLTRATLAAILKYPRTRSADRESASWRKFGAYLTERAEFNFARTLLPGKGVKTLEAAVMDYADDVAYSTHDIEDFYRAGLIPIDRLAAHQPDEREKFLAEAAGILARKGVTSRVALEILAALRILPAPLKAPFEGSRDQLVALQEFVSQRISRFIRNGVRLTRDSASSHLEIDDDIRAKSRC